MGQLIHHLGERHCVGVLYLRSKGEPGIDPAIEARCDAVWEIARPDIPDAREYPWAFRWRFVKRHLQGLPAWVLDWRSKEYSDQLDAVIDAWSPDVIQSEFSVMGQYLPTVRDKRIPRVLTVYEPTAHAARERPLRPRRRAWELFLESAAWRRYERRVIASSSAVVVFTERDQALIRGMSPQARVEYIPPGVELPQEPLDPLGCSPPSIVFIGNFDHPPNADAAERLASSIFPKVRETIPDLTLFIVGDRAPDHLREMANESMVVTGWVPSVVPYLNRANLVVAPLRTGGGIRIKILEALAAGKAIVASPRAVEGIPIQPDVHFVLADDDQRFAAAITLLLEHDRCRNELATNARAWAVANLGWDLRITCYEQLYTSLTEDARRNK